MQEFTRVWYPRKSYAEHMAPWHNAAPPEPIPAKKLMKRYVQSQKCMLKTWRTWEHSLRMIFLNFEQSGSSHVKISWTEYWRSCLWCVVLTTTCHSLTRISGTITTCHGVLTPWRYNSWRRSHSIHGQDGGSQFRPTKQHLCCVFRVPNGYG